MSACLATTGLSIERARADQARALYPLMRAGNPALRLPDWLRFARAAASGTAGAPRGILVAWRRPPNCPAGAVCYRRDPDPAHGIILSAEHFIALDLLHPGAVIHALVQSLDGLAQRLGCHAIRSIVHPQGALLVNSLIAAGHFQDRLVLTRVVPASMPKADNADMVLSLVVP